MNPGTLSLLVPFGFGPLAVTNGYGGRVEDDTAPEPPGLPPGALERSPRLMAARRQAPKILGAYHPNKSHKG